MTKTTTDLGKFGWNEWVMLKKIIDAMVEDGLPDDFENDDVHPMFNKDSGKVFLTNSNYQVAMMNGNKLESFYSCPECGHEGFLEEMGKENGHGFSDECADYIRMIAA